MTDIITKGNLFRPVRQKAETKAEITTHAARTIIEGEAERREAKTAKLREARLAREASEAAAPPAKQSRGKAAGRRTNSKS